MINGRSCLKSSDIAFNVIFIFIFLIFAPFHIGFISSLVGLMPHPNKRSNRKIINNIENNKGNGEGKKEMCIGFFSFFYLLFQRNINVSIYYNIFSFFIFDIIAWNFFKKIFL